MIVVVSFFIIPVLVLIGFVAFKDEVVVTLDSDIENVIEKKQFDYAGKLFLFSLAFAIGLAMLLYAILGDKRLIEEFGITALVIGIELIFLLFFIIVNAYTLHDVREHCITEKNRLEKEDKEQKETLAKKQKYFDDFVEKLQKSYGKADKILCLEELIPETAIMAFSETKMLFVQGNIIFFNKIIGYSLLDNSKQVTTTSGTMIGETNADSSSVVGRSIVGGLIGGEAGAIIGGATASTTTETRVNTTSTTHTHHHYFVKLQIADIANPILTIDFKDDENIAYEFVGLINAILSINKTNQAISQN